MATQISNYINDLRRYNRSPVTLRIATFTLTKAEKEIGKSLLEINNGEIENWILDADITPRSKLEYLGRIDQFYKWAIRKEYVAKNPLGDLMNVIKANPVKKHPALTSEQVRQLIMTAGDIRRMTVLLFAYKTGLRRNELWRLTIDDIDMDNMKVNVKERKGGKKGLYVFFDEETMNYLHAYFKMRKPKNPQERALFLDSFGRKFSTPETLARIVDSVIEVSGYKEVTLHSFRHFFTSHLNMNRIHPKALQVLRGDSNRGMIDYYTEVTDDWVKAEYLKCIPNLNLPRLNV